VNLNVHVGDWKPKQRPVEVILERLVTLELLRRKCKELDYKPSQFWYEAKIEALLWVLGINFERVFLCNWDDGDLLSLLKKEYKKAMKEKKCST